MLMQETGVTVVDAYRGQSRRKKKRKGMDNKHDFFIFLYQGLKKGETGCKKAKSKEDDRQE